MFLILAAPLNAVSIHTESWIKLLGKAQWAQCCIVFAVVLSAAAAAYFLIKSSLKRSAKRLPAWDADLAAEEKTKDDAVLLAVITAAVYSYIQSEKPKSRYRIKSFKRL